MTPTPDGLTVADARGLADWRCARCQQLLARCEVTGGQVEIKCRKCGTVNTLKILEKYGTRMTTAYPEGRASG